MATPPSTAPSQSPTRTSPDTATRLHIDCSLHRVERGARVITRGPGGKRRALSYGGPRRDWPLLACKTIDSRPYCWLWRTDRSTVDACQRSAAVCHRRMLTED